MLTERANKKKEPLAERPVRPAFHGTPVTDHSVEIRSSSRSSERPSPVAIARSPLPPQSKPFWKSTPSPDMATRPRPAVEDDRLEGLALASSCFAGGPARCRFADLGTPDVDAPRDAPPRVPLRTQAHPLPRVLLSMPYLNGSTGSRCTPRSVPPPSLY